MRGLPELSALLDGLPALVGISRKSMIYKPLGLTPADALPGTTALNTLALERGAAIIRVHDVAGRGADPRRDAAFQPTPL